MSGEHIISANQFGDADAVTVRGLPWCSDAPRTVGIKSFVANILCRAHNQMLSPLDDAAAATLRAFTEVVDRALRRGQRLPDRVFQVSGEALERWLLKTTINVALVGDEVPRAGIFDEDGNPARRYIEIAFGQGDARFDHDEGLFWVLRANESIAFAHLGGIEFQGWYRREDRALVGTFLRFHGWRMWLATRGAPAIDDAMHPTELKAEDLGVRVEVTWPSWRRRQFSRARTSAA